MTFFVKPDLHHLLRHYRQPATDEAEVVRGEAKSGTTHFHLKEEIMFARKQFTMTVCVMLAVMLAFKVPLTFAATSIPPSCDCKITEVIEAGGGLRLVSVQTDSGQTYQVATRTVREGRGQRMTFWVIETEQQLNQLRHALRSVSFENGLPQSGSVSAGYQTNDWASLPMGSSVYWDGSLVMVYISHDFATFLTAGTGAVAVLCALLAIVPPGALPAAVCAVFWGLSTTAIVYYDNTGAPRFWVWARNSAGAITTGIIA